MFIQALILAWTRLTLVILPVCPAYWEPRRGARTSCCCLRRKPKWKQRLTWNTKTVSWQKPGTLCVTVDVASRFDGLKYVLNPMTCRGRLLWLQTTVAVHVYGLISHSFEGLYTGRWSCQKFWFKVGGATSWFNQWVTSQWLRSSLIHSTWQKVAFLWWTESWLNSLGPVSVHLDDLSDSGFCPQQPRVASVLQRVPVVRAAVAVQDVVAVQTLRAADFVQLEVLRVVGEVEGPQCRLLQDNTGIIELWGFFVCFFKCLKRSIFFQAFNSLSSLQSLFWFQFVTT